MTTTNQPERPTNTLTGDEHCGGAYAPKRSRGASVVVCTPPHRQCQGYESCQLAVERGSA